MSDSQACSSRSRLVLDRAGPSKTATCYSTQISGWLAKMPDSFGLLKCENDACQSKATSYDLHLELQKSNTRWNNTSIDPKGWAAKASDLFFGSWKKDLAYKRQPVNNTTTIIGLANLHTCLWSLRATPQRFTDSNGTCHHGLHAYP